MSDNIDVTPGTGATVATDDCGAAGHTQVVKLAIATDGSATLIPADGTNGLKVDIARWAVSTSGPAKAEDVGSADADMGMPAMAVRKATPANTSGSDADYEFLQMSAGRLWVSGDNQAGDIAHGTADSGNPVKQGAVAIAHGTNPTAVAAAARTNVYANRAGIPFVMGGHPNVVTVKHTTITTAVTDAAIIASISSGTKVVVTAITATLDNASTVFPTLLVGFGATNTPTTTGVILAHGGVPAGGGVSRGDGSGIIGIGGDGEELRVTTTGNATGNGLQIVVTYYTIES